LKIIFVNQLPWDWFTKMIHMLCQSFTSWHCERCR